MANVFVQFTIDIVCKCHKFAPNSSSLYSFFKSALFLRLKYFNIFYNFFMNFKRSQTKDTLEFTFRTRNIMMQSDVIEIIEIFKDYHGHLLSYDEFECDVNLSHLQTKSTVNCTDTLIMT